MRDHDSERLEEMGRMDNRFLFRAAPKNDPDAKGLIFDVIEIDYNNETVSVDAGDILPWEYDCEDVELLCCTGLSAAKSYRGDKPEDLLVWEHDRIKRHGKDSSCYSVGTVHWSDERFKYIICFDNGAVEQLDVFWGIPCEIIGCIHDQEGGDK